MTGIEKVVGSILGIVVAIILIYAFAQALLSISVIVGLVFILVAGAYIYKEYIA